MLFYDWISRLKDKDSPTGDLAHDILGDKDFPKDINSIKELKDYLERHNACDGAFEALKTAWNSYNSYLKRH